MADKDTHSIMKQKKQRQNGNLADQVAGRLRRQIVKGLYRPGKHLSEPHLCEEFDISRNTLREVFRLLHKEGLVTHFPNKGVFVTIPDISTIIDIYNVRRIIECQAILNAKASQLVVDEMRNAVLAAQKLRAKDEWLSIGSADIEFHAAIVKLADSPRLSLFFAQISAQLRLVFGLINDPKYLHEPFINKNAQILALIDKGDVQKASQELKLYFDQAQQFIVDAYMARPKT